MPLSVLDINKLSTLISPNVDQVTCMECCKYYMVPSTAACGHTLCHGCWIGRKKCASCGAAVSRKTLKLNLQLQKMTEHTKGLRDEFEKAFNVNLDEFSLDTPIEKECSKDPAKNVRDWLANSENQFSAHIASQQSIQDLNNQIKDIESKVQVHSETFKTNSTKNTVHVSIPQDDWDKIEEMPDTEELNRKNKENAIGPMDIEPFVADIFEFTTDKPRRSSRKREYKGNNILLNSDVNSVEQNCTKDSTSRADIKVLKQNWSNVKRMKREFSKLNKKSKNKLNVSIEMCKKTLISGNKNIPQTTVNKSDELVLNIDDNTPNINNPQERVALTKENKENLEKEQSPDHNLFKDVEENTQKDIQSDAPRNKIMKHIELITNENVGREQLSNTCNTIEHQPVHKVIDQLPVPFFVKGKLQAPSIVENSNCCDKNNKQTIIVNTDNVEETKNSDDIEITIKIGNTVTNICIKKKEKDVQFKINADREIQTSLDKCISNTKNNAACSPIRGLDPENDVIIRVQNNDNVQDIKKCITNHKTSSAVKTPISKKNTESADTATVQYEITESIEKELSKEMEKADIESAPSSLKITKNANKLATDNDMLDNDCLNDLDLFDNYSVKEGNVQSLKSSNHAPSEILIFTMGSNKSMKQNKRDRDILSDDLPLTKKMKIIHERNDTQGIGNTSKTTRSNVIDQDSELDNYDFIMNKVFANIDLDLGKKTDDNKDKNSQIVEKRNDKFVTPLHSKAAPNNCDSIYGQSENVFSILEKENDGVDHLPNGKTQSNVKEKLVPAPKAVDCVELIDPELGTPMQDNNDQSDESIVEETPQKVAAFHNVRQKSYESTNTENTVKNKSLKLKRAESVSVQRTSSHTPDITGIINLSDITDDTVKKSKQITVLQAAKPTKDKRSTLETPLTINKFFDKIEHMSTPLAKKSLNFDNENVENCDVDPEQTLCPNSFLVAKTTQEREFMSKAFEDSPRAGAKSPITTRQIRMKPVKYCLAGSCLSPSEISNVKILCSLRNWTYLDKYTSDLTHLVVGVDEENKSQRSVKYMCALAASKWIVSYEWVHKCLQMKRIINEEPYEALDNTGEPGPQRSRLATQKLFKGMTFFCMPPFSVLDVNTLKGMLEAAGGRVVGEAKDVRVTSSDVALMLAEPEHTQENKFTYFAIELGVVPVNSEWALNCLGSYTITSVQELLLCPESLLPPATAHWPPELMAKDFD